MDISKFGQGGLIKPVDLRNYRLEVIPSAIVLPTKYSLRDKISKIKFQGTSSSCVAQATAYYVQLLNFLETGTQTEVSARDIYSMIFQPEGGSYIADAFKKVIDSGVAPETEATSYSADGSPTEAFMRNRSDISEQAQEDGMQFIAKKYVTWNNTNIDLYKQAIIQGNGMVAITWGNNPCWQVSPVAEPSFASQMVWKHGILFTGYNDETQQLEFVNSWGAKWGDVGFGYMPYSYVTKGYLANPNTLIDLPNNYYGLLKKLLGLLHNLVDLLLKK